MAFDPAAPAPSGLVDCAAYADGTRVADRGFNNRGVGSRSDQRDGTFALAVEEFFAVPPSVVIVGAQTETEALRASALALPLPGRRVWTMPEGGRLGTLNIPAQPRPAAYACARHGRSNAVIDGADIAAAVSPLV